MKGDTNLHEDKQQAFDLMSNDSIYGLVDCLLARVAICRNIHSKGKELNEAVHLIWNENKIISDFLTALFGSGFNHKVRNKKGETAYEIAQVLDGLSSEEVLNKASQVASKLY